MTVLSVVLTTCLVSAMNAETRKEFRYTVNAKDKAIISVDNQFGAITVKPGPVMHVSVVAIVQDKVQVDHLQKGNRIEIESQLLQNADKQTGRVDYELTVPPNAAVSLRSSTGPLVVDHVRGDITLEGVEGPVEVTNSGGGHVHVKTMSGPITLTDVHGAHVEITSISGEIRLNSVNGPLVQVHSGSGKIFYDGDFGQGGDYDFSTHTGDIEAMVPPGTSADFNAHSMEGQVQSDVSLVQNEHPRFPVEAGRSFFGTVGKAASEVVFKSFSGKIRLKRR
ncbi:MAG TPA: DUF4097 family beta strand repeat-containing protein [Terriglobales bacterium]|nr:DUF4097 family beta strand repeat-containing protein [Terriglobales bacterium]